MKSNKEIQNRQNTGEHSIFPTYAALKQEKRKITERTTHLPQEVPFGVVDT